MELYCTVEEMYAGIRAINDEIAALQTQRTSLEIETIKTGGFDNYQDFNAAYCEWEQNT